jgi:hypothetical protein
MLIPDWNSLDSVRHAHSELEATALVFFALLVIFDVLAHLSEGKGTERLFEKIALCFFAIAVLSEIAAYPYGQRNDDLSARIIGSLDIKAQRAADNASKAVTDSSTALSQAKDALTKAGAAETASGKAVDISGKAVASASNALSTARDARKEVDSLKEEAAGIQKQIAPRLLKPSEWEKIASPLRPFTLSLIGKKIELESYAMDQEGIVFAVEIWHVLDTAGIKADATDIGLIMGMGVPVETGVTITGPPADKDFINALGKAINLNADTPVHCEWNFKYTNLKIFVGFKPIEGLPNVTPKAP